MKVLKFPARAALVILLGSCSLPQGESADTAYAVGYLQTRLTSAERITPYSRLEDALGNAVIDPGSRQAAMPAPNTVLIGRVVDVQPMAGYVPLPEVDWLPGGRDAIAVKFGNPKALWRTVRLIVKVDEQLATAPSLEPGSQVSVGLAIGGPQEVEFPRLAQGLKALGSAAFFLTASGPVFNSDPTLYSIVEDGGFVASIDQSGTLTLPMLDPVRAEDLLANIDTLTELRAAAAGPPRSIPFPEGVN